MYYCIHSPEVNYSVHNCTRRRSETLMENSRAEILLKVYICTANLTFYNLSDARGPWGEGGGVLSNKPTSFPRSTFRSVVIHG